MRNPTMSPAVREAFLADVHLGVFSVNEPGRGPCTVPVWYRYIPDAAVRITASSKSRKVQLIRQEGRASMCVQNEALPYRYVSVEGPVEIVETQAEVEAEQRVIAERYLGSKLGERYLKRYEGALVSEVLLLLKPERWWSVDFSEVRF